MSRPDWRSRLESKMTTAEEAVRAIRSGDRVFIHGSSATPTELVEALASRAHELEDVRVTHLHIEGPAPHLAPGLENSFRHEALFMGGNAREAVQSGRADYIPVFLSDIPCLFRSHALRLDVALLHLTMPDEHGYCSLGTAVDVALSAAESARTVIALINPGMPRTLGDAFVHVDRLSHVVPIERSPIVVEVPPPTDIEQRIGTYVAELVNDGSTLQLGIGAIPNAVLAHLGDRRDLGVHTEMFSDGVVDLVNQGAITGAGKTIHRHKLVSSFIVGTDKVYRFVDNNPFVSMHPADYTNDTSIIRRNYRMVAINSAIEVDLTGQVVADSIGLRFYSGVGGQMDFIRGAALSQEGKAIIALPSTTRDGRVSRIVPLLKRGAGVVTTRAHVQYVVTEWGVAYLHGKSIRERVHELIRIAHPAFHEELQAFARSQLWI